MRTDFNQSAKLQWAFRWSNGNERSTNAGFPASGGTVVSKTIVHYNQFTGSNTWTVTPTIFNEARYGYTRFYNSLGTLPQGTNNAVGKSNIPDLNSGARSTWGILNIAFTGPNDPWAAIGDPNRSGMPLWPIYRPKTIMTRCI